MTATDQQRLGKGPWAIADQLRGAMNADEFRDYMRAFLFLCYPSNNYEVAAQSDRLSAFQTHKQGLFQQVFPSAAKTSA
jgi:type I restriction-modification system DNA methylase subunit